MLRLCNTLTRRLEYFIPKNPNEIKMFTCGPSIYRSPHIGNYRTFLFEDILQRYLEYLGFHVTRLISITDVEDKTLLEAAKENEQISTLTRKNEAAFFDNNESLKMKPFTLIGRSSTSVEKAVWIIKILLRKGYAYRYSHNGRENIYFDVLKFKNFGKLARINTREWSRKKRRYHKDTYPGMRWNKGDFILWHGHKNGDKVRWNTDIGAGRPSWNIQDAAIIVKHLGSKIDIACGGVDNLVRHHDYNIAIMEALSDKRLSECWLHCEHLLVERKKMSKSRGNVYYPSDFIEKGYTAQQLRFFLIYGHYRKKLNFSPEIFKQTVTKLDLLKRQIQELEKPKASESGSEIELIIKQMMASFKKSMDDDLDVKSAIDGLEKYIFKISALKKKGKLSGSDTKKLKQSLERIDSVLRVLY